MAVPFFLLLCLVGLAHGQTESMEMTTTEEMTTTSSHGGHHGHHGHASKPTSEPGEKESVNFGYIASEHVMVVHVGHDCYVANLTMDESSAVHSDAGIRSVELKLLSQMASATVVTVDDLPSKLAHACGHHTNMFYTIP